MKSASLLIILFFSMALVTFASIMVEAAAAEDPVIVGKWDRTDGVDVYTIYANHVTETVIEGQTYYGTWEYDGSGGYKYVFHWEHSPPGQAPFIDYVTVAADGQSYSGYNNYSDQFHCVRIGDAPTTESGGFPIVPVAIGGGVAAIAAVGAAAYYLLVAGKGVAKAGTAASTLSGASSGEASGTSEALAENSPGSLSTIEAEKQAEIDKLKVEIQNTQETVEKMAKDSKPGGTVTGQDKTPYKFDSVHSAHAQQAVNTNAPPENPVKVLLEKTNMTPKQQLEFLEKLKSMPMQPSQLSSPQGFPQPPSESEPLTPEYKEFREQRDKYYQQLKQQIENEGQVKQEVGDSGESSSTGAT